MSKIQVRWVLFGWLVLFVLSTTFEYILPNPIAQQAYEYVSNLEQEWTDGQFFIFSLLAGVSILSCIVAFVGLFLFRPWSRHLFVFSMLLPICLYPWLGVTVIDAYSLLLSELLTFLTAIIVMLLYYSPVAAFYEQDT